MKLFKCFFIAVMSVGLISCASSSINTNVDQLTGEKNHKLKIVANLSLGQMIVLQLTKKDKAEKASVLLTIAQSGVTFVPSHDEVMRIRANNKIYVFKKMKGAQNALATIDAGSVRQKNVSIVLDKISLKMLAQIAQSEQIIAQAMSPNESLAFSFSPSDIEKLKNFISL